MDMKNAQDKPEEGDKPGKERPEFPPGNPLKKSPPKHAPGSSPDTPATDPPRQPDNPERGKS